MVEELITKYPLDGSNVVEKLRFEIYYYEVIGIDEQGNPVYTDYLGNVFINDTHYFKGVPQSAWNFFIAGYQPVQKWFKAPQGRELSFEDYPSQSKDIVALTEAGRLMQGIVAIPKG